MCSSILVVCFVVLGTLQRLMLFLRCGATPFLILLRKLTNLQVPETGWTTGNKTLTWTLSQAASRVGKNHIPINKLVGGWTNPLEKYDIVKLDHFSKVRVNFQKYLSYHHLDETTVQVEIECIVDVSLGKQKPFQDITTFNKDWKWKTHYL